MNLAWRFVVPMLLGAMLWGCPSDDQGKAAADAAADTAAAPAAAVKSVDEAEPNEDRESAQLLELPVRITGFIHAPRDADGKGKPLPDQDWYKIAVPVGAAQVLRVELSGVPGINHKLELTDADGNDLSEANNNKEGGDEFIPNFSVEGGATLFVRVRELWKKSKERKFDEKNPYKLTVALTPRSEGEEIEPNNRQVDATTIRPGQMMTGFICCAQCWKEQDRDWYRIVLSDRGGDDAARPAADAAAGVEAPVPAADAEADTAAAPEAAAAGHKPVAAGSPYLRIELSGVPELRPTLGLYDEIGAALLERLASASGEPVRIRNLGLDPERKELFLATSLKWGCNAADRYTLSVVAETSGKLMEFEPNDRPVHATTIEDGQVLWGYLSGAGDADYYRLRVEEASQVRIEATGLEQVDLALEVYRDEETLLRGANEGSDKEGETISNVYLGPGFAYIKVAAKKGQENPDAPYSLTASLEADTGLKELEPNDDPAKATPIALGQTLRGYLHPRKDRDYYLIDLGQASGPVTVGLLLNGVPKVKFRLVLSSIEPDEEGKLPELAAATATKAEQELQLDKELPPGRYLIEVRDDDDRQSNPRDEYRLTVSRK